MKILTITDLYENGDPGGPLGCEAVFLEDGHLLAEIKFFNEENEWLQEKIEKIAAEEGYEIKRDSNVNNDYGYV